jgi:hypothetical protein
VYIEDMARKSKKTRSSSSGRMSATFHRDWHMMMLALLGAGLAIFIGLSAGSSKSYQPQVAGDYDSVGLK